MARPRKNLGPTKMVFPSAPVEAPVVEAPVEQPVRKSRLEYCASGRSRAEVHQQLDQMRSLQRLVDQDLTKDRVELCRQDWETKYRGEYPFNPACAYTATIDGARLDPAKCLKLYNVSVMVAELEKELAEKAE